MTDERDLGDSDAPWMPRADEPEPLGPYVGSASPEGDDPRDPPADSAHRLGSERHGWFRPLPSLRARLQGPAGREETAPNSRLGESHDEPAAPMPLASAANAPVPGPGSEGLPGASPPEVVDQPPPAPQAILEKTPATDRDVVTRQLEIERERLKALREVAEQGRQQLEDERRALEVVRAEAQRVLEQAERMAAEKAGRPEPPDRSDPPVKPTSTVARAPSVGPPPQTWEAASSSIPPGLAEEPPPVTARAGAEQEPAPQPSPPPVPTRAGPEEDPAPQPSPPGDSRSRPVILPKSGEELGGKSGAGEGLTDTGGQAPGGDLTLEEAARIYKFPIDRLRRRASGGGVPGAYTVTTAEGTEWRVPRAALAALGYRPVAEMELEREVRSRFGPDQVADDQSEHAPQQILQRPLPPKVQVRIAPGGAGHADVTGLRGQLDEEHRQLKELMSELQRAAEELEKQRIRDLERQRHELELMLETLAADRRQLEADRKRLTEHNVEEEFRLQREGDRLAAEAAAQRARFEVERAELDQEWAEAEDWIERAERLEIERAERLETERAAEHRRLEAARREIERLDEERRRLEERAARRREPVRQPDPVARPEPVRQPEPEPEPAPEVVAEEPRPRPSRAGRAARRQERSRQSFPAGRWRLAERTRVALSTPPEAEEAAQGSDGETAAAARPRRAQGPRQNGEGQSSKFRVVSPVVDPEGQYCPPTHPVKAKLSSGLFHLPGMSAYDRTRPDRCYRDGEAAEAAGLTRAKR